MVLKFKAFIYRHTGLYLAPKEELEYINSFEFWAEYYSLIGNNDDLSPRNAHSILQGSWQADHGFLRKIKLK